MDLNAFVRDLLRAVADAGWLESLEIEIEGRLAQGYVRFGEGMFVRFFFNEETLTLAVALIAGQQRIWGVDHDKRRGWHRHPLGTPQKHVAITPPLLADIIRELAEVVQTIDLQ